MSFADDFKALFARACDGESEQSVNPLNALLELGLFSKDVQSKMVQFENTASSFRSDVMRLEDMMQKRMNQIEDGIECMRVRSADCQKSINAIEHSMNTKASYEQVDRLEADVSSFRSEVGSKLGTLEKGLNEKASSAEVLDQFESMGSHITALKQHIIGIDQSVNDLDKAGVEQLEQVKGELSSQIRGIDRAIQDKASRQEVSEHISFMQSQIGNLDQSVVGLRKSGAEQLEQVKAQLSCQIHTIEQAMHEKPSCREVQCLGTDINIIRSQMGLQLEGLSKALNEKASASQMLDSISALQLEVNRVDESMRARDNVGTEQFMQRVKAELARIPSQINAIEQAVCEKASRDQLKQLDCNLTSMHTLMHSKLESLNKALNEKASAYQMLESTTAMDRVVNEKASVEQLEEIQAQVSGMWTKLEEQMQAKAGSNQLSKLENLVDGVGLKIINFEKALSEKAVASTMEHDVEVIKSRVSDLEFSVRDKVSFGQLQRLETQVSCVQTEINAAEQATKGYLAEVEKSLQQKLERCDKTGKNLAVNFAQNSSDTKGCIEKLEKAMATKDDLSQLSHALDSNITQVANLYERLHLKLNLKADAAVKNDIQEVALNLERKADAQVDAAARDLASKLANSTEQLMNLVAVPVNMPCTPRTARGNAAPGTPGALLQRKRAYSADGHPPMPTTPGFGHCDKRPAPSTPGLIPCNVPTTPAPSTPCHSALEFSPGPSSFHPAKRQASFRNL